MFTAMKRSHRARTHTSNLINAETLSWTKQIHYYFVGLRLYVRAVFPHLAPSFIYRFIMYLRWVHVLKCKIENLVFCNKQ